MKHLGNEWRAPFGERAIGILPGQYFDAEVQLHQNWYRDYDPATDRYLQFDPIGLRGGINGYIYARANPLRFTDPNGLFFISPVPGLPDDANPPPPAPDVPNDTSACSYYGDVAGKYGCKYHAFAVGVCQGKNVPVEVLTRFVCQITNAQLNRIRTCLVSADKAARSNPSCRAGTCGNCTKKSCITTYHNSCFESAGVSKHCFGGNPPWSWIRNYPSDD